MQSTDRDRILVTDFAAERARLGEANMVRLARVCGHRLRRVEWRRTCSVPYRAGGLFSLRRASGFWGKMIGAATEASISSPICSLAVAEPSSAIEPAGSSTEACVDWIDASLSLKALSTRSAAAAISVFLAGMFLWTQSAASSSDWSCATVASNCSRNVDDCSGSSVARAGRSDLSRGPEAGVVCYLGYRNPRDADRFDLPREIIKNADPAREADGGLAALAVWSMVLNPFSFVDPRP